MISELHWVSSILYLPSSKLIFYKLILYLFIHYFNRSIIHCYSECSTDCMVISISKGNQLKIRDQGSIGNQFAVKLIALAVIPALAIFALSLFLLSQVQHTTSDYLSLQTQVSLEQLYRSQLQARSRELSTTLNEKFSSIINETQLLANRTQFAIDNPSNAEQSISFTFKQVPGGAYSEQNQFDTVVAVWPYLLEPSGQINNTSIEVIQTYQALNPFLASLRQSGVKKSWSYIIGPKRAPLVYATPWANIPATFEQLYPEHKQHNFWDYFFPGMIESWQQWKTTQLPKQQITFTPIYEDAGGKGNLITSFHPLWQQEKNYGAVAIDVSVEQLLGLVVDEKIQKRGFATVISSQGELIGTDQAQAALLGLTDEQTGESQGVRLKQYKLSDSQYPALNNIDLTGDSFFYQLTLGQQTLYLSGSKIAQINVWLGGDIKPVNYYATFVLGQDEVIAIKEQLANRLANNIDKTVSQATWWSVVATFIAIICAFLVALNYRRRIHTIIIAAKSFSERNFALKLSTKGNDEVSFLAAQINTMGKQLSEYDKLQQQTNEKLSQQVKERTELLEAARKESEKANVAKTSFLASMSHEIRTPLTTVIGYSDAILNGYISHSEQKEATRKIAQSGQHLLLLVNDILDISKIEAGQLTLESRNFNLLNLINEIFDYAQFSASETNNTFNAVIHYPIITLIQSDEVRLKQVLLNLLSNAFKFTKDGEVELQIRQHRHAIEFMVTDNGVGISEDNLNHIFKPFEQIHTSTNRLYGGTGLGLNICHQLVTLMKGKINVESKLGVGSQFTFSLPLQSNRYPQVFSNTEFNQAVNESRLEQDIQPQSIQGKVLLAEDNEHNSLLVQKRLQRMGLDVFIARDGEEAVAVALGNDVDLILMDIQMPRLSGIEALKQLQQAGLKTPTYAFTANVLSHEVSDYLAQGFSGYLAKPIDNIALLKVINKELRLPNHQHAPTLLPDEVTELKKEFILGLRSYLALLTKAWQAQDKQRLIELCHCIKGAAGNFDEPAIVSLCNHLENYLKQNDNTDCVIQFEQLRDEIHRLTT